MRQAINTSIFVFSCLLSVLGQQTRTGDRRAKYVIAPAENVLITIASQKDCPLKVEDARFLLRADGSVNGQMIIYRVRNTSSKPVVSFTIEALSESGSGGEVIFALDTPLMPGQVLEIPEEGVDYELTSMTNQVRNKLPSNEMIALHIVLVSNVNFKDGSTFRDKKTSDTLKKFLAKLNEVSG